MKVEVDRGLCPEELVSILKKLPAAELKRTTCPFSLDRYL
jgi:hypothetical protein